MGFPKEKGLEPKIKKISKIVYVGRRGEETSLVQTCHWRGSGAPLGDFLDFFFEKNSYFNAIWITFRTFLEPFKITKSLRTESQLKQLN